MKDLVKKLQGHTNHLLRFFSELLERYAYLEPMFFQEEVIKSFNSVKEGRGFDVIRYSLFFDCIQDVAKMTMDEDKKKKRTPSIKNIMEGLSCQCARNMLREEFAKTSSDIPEDADEAVKESCKRIKNQVEAERYELFDSTYKDLLNKWEGIKNNQQIKAFCIIRDRLTAHLQLNMVNGSYQFTDISTLGLQWGDLGDTLSDLKPIIQNLNLIINNGSSDIDDREAEFNKMADKFWRKVTVKREGA